MDETWMKDANCLGYPKAMFFEGFEEASLTEKMNTIKMCVDCPVADQCLAYGLSFSDTEGIFGGRFFKKGKAKDPFKVRKSLKKKKVLV